MIRTIGRLADEKKYPVYLVGGIVRDILLKKANLDLDIVIEGEGIKFTRQLANKIKVKPVYHQKFGTATLLLPEHFKIDIASARKEIYEFSGALPKVIPGTIEDDLLRRDFSINALAIQLNRKRFGELIDCCEGKKDLYQKSVRVLHDFSFIEDPTRILRAIRFKERLNFSWEDHTLKLLRGAVNKNVFSAVKPPRLFAEVIKLLKEPQAKKNILAVGRLCGWNFISPRIKTAKETLRLVATIERQINWFQTQFPKWRKLDTWLIYFMALVDGLSLKEKKVLFERFNLRAGDRKRIESGHSLNGRVLKLLVRNKLSPSQVYTLLEPLSYEVLIFLKARNHSPLINRRMVEFLKFSHPMRISIKGADLKMMGGREDKEIGKTLLKVLHAKIDGKRMTRREELRLARRLIY